MGNKSTESSRNPFMLFSLGSKKRGWIRILEATIAVLIVAGVLVVFYAEQSDGGSGSADYIYNLQKQILIGVSSSSDLRLMVLNDNESGLNLSIAEEVPGSFGYYVRICELGNVTDFCKIDNPGVVAEIRNKDVFVEEIIVSADLGDGTNEKYEPKKVRLFVWER